MKRPGVFLLDKSKIAMIINMNKYGRTDSLYLTGNKKARR